nr:MAG: ORF2 protein [Xinmoviridae sp. 1]
MAGIPTTSEEVEVPQPYAGFRFFKETTNIPMINWSLTELEPEDHSEFFLKHLASDLSERLLKTLSTDALTAAADLNIGYIVINKFYTYYLTACDTVGPFTALMNIASELNELNAANKNAILGHIMSISQNKFKFDNVSKFMMPLVVLFALCKRRPIHFELLLLQLDKPMLVQIMANFCYSKSPGENVYFINGISSQTINQLVDLIENEANDHFGKSHIPLNVVNTTTVSSHVKVKTLYLTNYPGKSFIIEDSNQTVITNEQPEAEEQIEADQTTNIVSVSSCSNETIEKLFKEIPDHLGLFNLTCIKSSAYLNNCKNWKEIEESVIIPSLIKYMESSGEDRLYDYINCAKELVNIPVESKETEKTNEIDLRNFMAEIHIELGKIQNEIHIIRSNPAQQQAITSSAIRPTITIESREVRQPHSENPLGDFLSALR